MSPSTLSSMPQTVLSSLLYLVSNSPTVLRLEGTYSSLVLLSLHEDSLLPYRSTVDGEAVAKILRVHEALCIPQKVIGVADQTAYNKGDSLTKCKVLRWGELTGFFPH